MGLLIPTVAALVLLLVSILWWRLHAFLALLIAALGLALASGMSPGDILTSFQNGIGGLLGSIALIIGAGAILGRLIEVSGGGSVLAERMTVVFGRQRLSLAMLVTGYLVGIPVFFDAAFFTLIPLIWGLSESSGRSLLFYALPILASLTMTHGLLPTHPGPAAAAQLLGANLGRTTILGLLLAIPSAVAGGLGYGIWIARRMPVMRRPEDRSGAAIPAWGGSRPSFAGVLMLVLLPVLLIASGAFATGFVSAESRALAWLKFWGDPSVALLVSALLAFVLFGRHSGLKPDALLGQVSGSLNSIGSLILIIGAAGALKQVIVDSGAGNEFAGTLLRFHVPPLLSAFLVGAVLRIALGSATASIVTAAGLVAPVAVTYSGDRALLLLSLALGASIFANVNDAGFWMVQEYCGLTVPQTLMSYSLVKTASSLVGFVLICLLGLFQ